jgi:hypothetical protein
MVGVATATGHIWRGSSVETNGEGRDADKKKCCMRENTSSPY